MSPIATLEVHFDQATADVAVPDVFLEFLEEAPITLHYFLCMQAMHLGTCGLER